MGKSAAIAEIEAAEQHALDAAEQLATAPARPAPVDPIRALLARDSADQAREAMERAQTNGPQPGSIAHRRPGLAYRVIDTTGPKQHVQETRASWANDGWRPITGPYADGPPPDEYVVGMPQAELWAMDAKTARKFREARIARDRDLDSHESVRKGRVIQIPV